MTDESKPDEKPDYRHARWLKHFDEIDREIAQLAAVCNIQILDPGVIERVLQQTRWNRKEAAERLQISYKALLYKMKENGLSDGR
mgnify:CR=1 FL=1